NWSARSTARTSGPARPWLVNAMAPLEPALVETDFGLVAGEVLRRERRWRNWPAGAPTPRRVRGGGRPPYPRRAGPAARRSPAPPCPRLSASRRSTRWRRLAAVPEVGW